MISSPAAQLFLAIGVLILLAKLAGYISFRFKQPTMVGILFIGVILGPSLLDFFHSSIFIHDPTPAIGTLAEFGFLLLVFSAGLEIQLEDLQRHSRAIFLSANLGVIVTLILVIPVMLAANYNWTVALFTAIALAGTGNGVAAQLAFEMNLIRFKEGIIMLGAAMVDDVLVVLLLSILVAVHLQSGGGEIVFILLRLALFLLIAVPFGWWFLPRLLEWSASLPIDAGVLAIGFCAMLLFSWSAERFGGMTPITGAFMAGVCMVRAPKEVLKTLSQGVYQLGYGFFIPIFLVNIGLRTDTHELDLANVPLIIGLFIMAVLGKVGGSGIGAYWGGLKPKSALQIGLTMIPRGAVGLAISTIGLDNDLISSELFPEIVLVILMTTLIAPLLVRYFLALQDETEMINFPSKTVT